MISISHRRRFRTLAIVVCILLFFPVLCAGAEETTITVRILEKHVHDLFTLSSAEGLNVVIDSAVSAPSGPVILSSTAGGFDLTMGDGTTFLPRGERAVFTPFVPDEPITVAIEEPSLTRSYRGDIVVTFDEAGPIIVNRVCLSDYLASVVGGEMGGDEEAALMAQAILSRTWVLTHLNAHDTADLCDLTHCQSYTGVETETPAAVRATKKTEGLIMTYQGEPAMVFYHACAGGMTTSPEYVWNGPEIPYLVPVVELYRGRDLTAGSPHRLWEWRVGADELLDMLSASFGETYDTVSVSERDPSGRAMRVLLSGEKDRIVTGEELRIAVGREFGWGCLKSTLFDVKVEGGEYVFFGKGLGHGVGLSQWGAMELARSGLTAEEIVLFYFPNTEIVPLSDPFGSAPISKR